MLENVASPEDFDNAIEQYTFIYPEDTENINELKSFVSKGDFNQGLSNIKQAISSLQAEFAETAEQFTLSPGQTRYTETGEIVAAAGGEDLETTKTRLEIEKLEQELLSKKTAALEAEQKKELNIKQTVSTIDNTLNIIDKAMTQVRDDISATGIVGAVTSVVPGSPSANLRARLETVKANLAFDTLQKMRAASPTGGALGSVSERELSLLEGAVASLSPNQNDAQLLEGLETVKKHYNNWKMTLEGKNPESITEDARSVEDLSDEELQRIINGK